MASQPPIDTATATPEAAVENSTAQLASLYGDDKPRDDAPAQGEQQLEEQAGEGDEQQPADDLPAIDAPASWAKDAKEVFAGLPREAQEVIATRERDRDTEVRRSQTAAAEARQAAEREASGRVRQVMEQTAAQLGQYASMFEPQPPDINLLYSQNPQEQALYYEQDRQYRTAAANREHLTARQQEALRQANALAEQEQVQAMQAEDQVLADKLGTEWSDPSERATLLQKLEPIAAELGYSQEVMAQAGAADILALKKALDWKAKAEKYDQQNKAKMVQVRQARAIPPATRPGAPAAQQGPKSTLDVLYPNDVRRN